jgi:hypothetical protein
MIEALLLAQLAAPVPYAGPCPMNYIRQGNYCTPLRQAKDAISKQGSSCPMGYYESGNYCSRFGSY